MKDYLIDPLKNLASYKNILKDIKNGLSPIGTYGIVDESLSQILMGLNTHTKKQVLLITESEQKSRILYEDIINLSNIDVEMFPQKETFFYDIDVSSNENLNQRLKVISRLASGEDLIVIASIDALLDKIISEDIFEEYTLKINENSIIDLNMVSEKLIQSGYERTATVESKGQFSIRGGILDVFSPHFSFPCRIELFGDEVDSIRQFDVLSQRSLEIVENIDIVPTKEILILHRWREGIAESIKKDLKSYKKHEKILEKFNTYIELLEEGSTLKNQDMVIPYIPKESVGSIIDYFKKEALIFIQEPQRIEHRSKGLEEDLALKITDLLESGEAMRSHIDTNYRYSEIIPWIEERIVITNSVILKGQAYFNPKSIYNFSMKATNNYHSKMELLLEDLNHYKYRGYKIILLSGTEERGMRLKKTLEDLDFIASFSEDRNGEIKSNQAIITPGSINGGFEYSNLKLIVISDKEIFGAQKKKLKRIKKEKDREVINLGDLEIGAFIVHENHGIGRYEGIEQLDIQGVKKDYLTIRYRNNDKLYISIDQMDLVQKYIGSESIKPKLNKLNSVEWKNTKARAKKAVEDMAADLLNLYARRESEKGFKFNKDTVWQREFEDLFPYEDTPGQAKSSLEIKDDMEKQKPMDRLLCGDVGYGKTEVALRASFKAIMDGKQVAILVPTTILAQQHYNTMVERFKDFPINIGLLSRFRTRKLQNQTTQGLVEGNVDIVVGTHRLLSKDVKFNNLGLLIIDEEQRFGVKHKETLKELKTNIDVLTLTATPIPRTLHMSLVGIRDMSVIEDPPAERYPIQTYVVEYNPQMIRDAILKEISRGGQVYFVYNRVQTIDKVANEIRKLVPEAHVGIGHGQMSERQLEKVMMGFLDKEYDVLVCTTIIETGLDIPNVNTIIVYDADKMGLSQLYQLRGRVGRTNRLAYGYFTYQPNKVLTEVSEKRLRAIKEFTEFGSGFKIAMRDLEIRGSGNLLGLQQHGNIEAIGYDLYVKFLGRAIRRLKGEKIEEEIETTVDIKVNSFIPIKFIKDEELKIEVYKKISVIENIDDYRELLDELIDRFGDIPKEIENLMNISLIKAIASRNKIKNIIQMEDKLRLDLVTSESISLPLIDELSKEYGKKLIFSLSNNPYIELKYGDNILKISKELIERIDNFNKKEDKT